MDLFKIISLDRTDLHPSGPQSELYLVKQDIKDLQLTSDRLLKITEVLWGILKEKHGYSDEELIRRVEKIDAVREVVGKRTAMEDPPICRECNRSHIAINSPLCLYCGAPMPRQVEQKND